MEALSLGKLRGQCQGCYLCGFSCVLPGAGVRLSSSAIKMPQKSTEEAHCLRGLFTDGLTGLLSARCTQLAGLLPLRAPVRVWGGAPTQMKCPLRALWAPSPSSHSV